MLGRAWRVQCIIRVKVTVVTTPARKCCTTTLSRRHTEDKTEKNITKEMTRERWTVITESVIIGEDSDHHRRGQ